MVAVREDSGTPPLAILRVTVSRMANTDTVTITFLGGLGEIGNNCMYIEDHGSILVIDCGLMFPEIRMLGIDIGVPDFSSLVPKADQVVGLVLTHGHEDHIGALTHLLPELSCPVYASELAVALARKRVSERHLAKGASLETVTDFEVIEAGPFTIEFIPVAHSVPQGHSIAIHTSAGLLLHTGDFKLDPSPYDGRFTGFDRWMELSTNPGIRLLMVDSTNADEPGWTESERAVFPALSTAMSEAKGERVIATCFASHLHRIAQIIEAARIHGRKVLPIGHSLERSVAIARELGILDFGDDQIVDRSQAAQLEPGELCVVCTGSQGEPRSALARMSEGNHRDIKLDENDVIIMSSHAIPGNEAEVSGMINNLVRRGTRVIHAGFAKVHVSGHANADELHHTVQSLRPTSVVPIHGEYRHLDAVRRLTNDATGSETGVLICEDGDVIELTSDDGPAIVAEVPASPVYVGPGSVGDVEESTIRDRRSLMNAGVMSVVLAVEPGNQRASEVVSLQHFGWVSEGFWRGLLPDLNEFLLDRLQFSGDKDSTPEDDVVRQLGRMLMKRFKSKPYIQVKILDD